MNVAAGLVIKAMASIVHLMARAMESNAMTTPRVLNLCLKNLACARVKMAGEAMDGPVMISMSAILPRIVATKMLTV